MLGIGLGVGAAALTAGGIALALRNSKEKPKEAPQSPESDPQTAPDPDTTARAARYAAHYREHQRDPKVSNTELVEMIRSLRDMPGVNQKGIDMASTVIARTKVELDYDVFSKIYKNDPVEQAHMMSDPYSGVHVRRSPSMRATHSPATSFIYVRPSRAPGTKLTFDPNRVQHQVLKTVKDIRLASITGESEIPRFFSSDRILGTRTETDEAITLIHELGHAVHARASYTNPDIVPIRKSVVPFVSTNSRGVSQHPMGHLEVDTNSVIFRSHARRVLTQYGYTEDFDKRRKETFAEGFVVYMTQGEYMRKEAPLFYSWVDHIVRAAYRHG